VQVNLSDVPFKNFLNAPKLTYNYEVCSESNAPHFFFSETIYSECMKFTHSITGCFLYTCKSPSPSPSSRTWLREQETSWFREGMHALVSRWRKAVDVDGNYVEK
jgi:hypothetical protein